MYRENDFLMHHDGASDDFIKQLLENGSSVSCNSSDAGENSCGCNENAHKSWGLYGYPLAMVYSPVQEWRSLYDNEMGLKRGTIFKELDLPFRGMWSDGDGTCRGGCKDEVRG